MIMLAPKELTGKAGIVMGKGIPEEGVVLTEAEWKLLKQYEARWWETKYEGSPVLERYKNGEDPWDIFPVEDGFLSEWDLQFKNKAI